MVHEALPPSKMYTRLPFLLGALCVVLVGFPFYSSAQQLRITESTRTEIENTGTYRAYYGKLSGEPHTYSFTVREETPVTFVVLVPDVAGSKADLAISLTSKISPESPLSTVDGALFEWTQFFDTAGRDSYLAGPSLQATVPAGEYEVSIMNPGNTAPYVLIVGNESAFSIAETLRRYGTLPAIKSQFFQKSPIEAYVTPLLLWPIFALLIAAGVVIFSIIVYRRRMSTSVL